MPLRLKAVNSGIPNITVTEGKAHRKSNATVNTQAPRVFSTGISGKVELLVAVDMASGTEGRTTLKNLGLGGQLALCQV